MGRYPGLVNDALFVDTYLIIFGTAAPESIRSLALTPAHTLSGSLSPDSIRTSPAERLLVSFSAFTYFFIVVSSITGAQVKCQVST